MAEETKVQYPSPNTMEVYRKLIVDQEFRGDFFEDSEAALGATGLVLSEEEKASFREIDQQALGELLTDVDERLSKSGASIESTLEILAAAALVATAATIATDTYANSWW